MEKDLRLRKIRGRLYSNGQAIVIFSIWDVIQVIMMFLLNREYVIEKSGVEETNQFIITLAFIFVGIIALLATLIDVYIGRSAMSYARGKHKGILFLVIGFLALIVSLASLGSSIVGYVNDLSQMNAKTLIETIVTLTKNIIMIELIINSIQLKRSEVK